jgi:phenylalanyl-tRNA synthetase beta chain
VLLNSRVIGRLGLLAPAVQKQFDLDVPVAIAELEVEPLLVLFPPRATPAPLPQFPGIERDLSLIVDEPVAWAQVRSLVQGAKLQRLEAVEFVGTYRGKQIGDGKKSLTLRLRFRDAGRTLRHEEVDPEVDGITTLLQREFAAEFRT